MKRLIPVIHIRDEEQALRNALLCHKNGCGVFLIHHKKRHPVLFEIAEKIHAEIPDLWIGVNALDLTAAESFAKTPLWVNAIWSDDSGLEEKSDLSFDYERAEVICDERVSRALRQKGQVEYFGGFAFKYQAPVRDLQTGAFIACSYMDTVTTSGDGTGIAADIEKIKKIRLGVDKSNDFDETLKPVRLGVASGITPENVKEYLPYVDDFLVATGISKDNYNIDEEKLRALHAKIV